MFSDFEVYDIKTNDNRREFDFSDQSPIVILKSKENTEDIRSGVVKIMSSINLNLDAERNILFLSQPLMVNQIILKPTNIKPVIFLFGIDETDLNIQSELLMNKLYKFEDFWVFKSWSVTELNKNVDKKRPLWVNLKKYFL